jgi:hypothetical protein
MITLFGFVALVASMGRLVVEKIRLQSAADLSAFSGAAIQAAGLNELARINEKIRDDIDYFERGEKTYRSEEAGEDAIERRMKQRVEEVIKQVRAYAQRARLRAGEAARHNYPGVEAYQVGVQVDPDSDDASMTREELRRFAARNDKGTNIKFYYRDDDGDRRRGSHDPDFLYHRPLSNTAFWARLEATIKPPALPSVFFLDAPDGILLTADSMASPYDGHTGRPSGKNLRDCRPEYRVKFTPINHRDLTLTVPSSRHFLVHNFRGVVQAGKYIVFRAEGTDIRDVVAPSVDPGVRRLYAH